MRQIKFKGFGIFEWVYGSLVRDGNKCYIVEEINVSNEHGDGTDFYATIWSEVTPESVGEYTGLKDKNGKEIYEGDILQGTNSKRYEIRWGINSNGFVALTKETHGNVYSSYHLAPKTEIIGNIYQNKELLRKVD